MSDELFKWTLIGILFVMLLAMIALISAIKKAQKNQEYNDFFKERNLDFENLSNSNKRIFRKKTTGICKNCKQEKEIYTDTRLCYNCTYTQNVEELNIKSNIIDIDNIAETTFPIKDFDKINAPKSCVFAVKIKNGPILDVIQTNNFKKEIKKLISLIKTSDAEEYNLMRENEIEIAIINYELTDNDLDNILEFIKQQQQQLYFVKQIIQMEYANKFNAKYWKPSNGDQKVVIENLSKESD